MQELLTGRTALRLHGEWLASWNWANQPVCLPNLEFRSSAHSCNSGKGPLPGLLRLHVAIAGLDFKIRC